VHGLPNQAEPAFHVSGTNNSDSQLALEKRIAGAASQRAVIGGASPAIVLQIVVSVAEGFVDERGGVTVAFGFGEALRGLAPPLQFAERQSLEEPGDSQAWVQFASASEQRQSAELVAEVVELHQAKL